MKRTLLILSSILIAVMLFVTACCLYYKVEGIEKVVVPKHINLNPSLYVVVMEKSYDKDTAFKEVFYKPRSSR